MQAVSSIFSYGSDFRSVEFPTFRKFFVSLHDHFIPHPRNNYHPHILSHRMLTLLALLLMTVKIAGISLVIVSPATTAEASQITNTTVVSLSNAARLEGGLQELKINGLLAQAAQAKANDMIAKQYFAHNTPDGKVPWDFIKATGYNYVTAGENLAIDFTEAESVQTAWMNSPGHRANIMNKAFQEIGIGISKGMFNGHETTIVVQMFGTPIAQKVTMPSTPTPVEKQVAVPTPPVVPAPAPATTQKTDTAPANSVPTAPSAPSAQVAKPITAPVPTPVQNTDVNTVAVPSANATNQIPVTPTLPTLVTEQPIANQAVEIKSIETTLQGNQLYITVTASGDVTKLLASYGDNSVMLDPAENNQWYGYIPMASLNGHPNLMVYAYDINGNLVHTPVGKFSSSLNTSLNQGTVEGASINLFGKTISKNIWEERIFFLVIAGLVACLILAIAIRRHVQHLSMIANTAFVVMLAAFMLML